jgi:cell wall-associated NlpC family hydrolase
MLRHCGRPHPPLKAAWLLAVPVLLSACQSPASLSRVDHGTVRELLSPLHQRLLSEVQRRLGIPYCYGGADDACTDCSGFVQQVFAALGIRLPRTSAEQATVGWAVPDAPRVGDIVVVLQGERVRHVGIYLGNGAVAHASRSRGVVIEPLPSVAAIGSTIRFRRLLSPPAPN